MGAYRSTYSGVMAQGYGGTNVYMLIFGEMDNDRVRQKPPFLHREVVYWPGGGGMLEDDQLPRQRDGYYIVGTWSKWENPVKMRDLGEGIFGYTVTLGENRWEQFQIWLDGDPKRAGHPNYPQMPSGSPVFGPDAAEFDGSSQDVRSGLAPTWIIDGRAEPLPMIEKPELDTKDGSLISSELEKVSDVDTIMVSSTGSGQVGDPYYVIFQFAGKWRMVTWEKLESKADLATIGTGTYFIAGTWSEWTLNPMESDKGGPGVFTADVRLLRDFEEFMIVRDMDWSQVFYPETDMIDGAEILGPDQNVDGLCWKIRGRRGDIFTVQFQRTSEDGKDVRKVTWVKTGRKELTTAEKT